MQYCISLWALKTWCYSCCVFCHSAVGDSVPCGDVKIPWHFSVQRHPLLHPGRVRSNSSEYWNTERQWGIFFYMALFYVLIYLHQWSHAPFPASYSPLPPLFSFLSSILFLSSSSVPDPFLVFTPPSQLIPPPALNLPAVVLLILTGKCDSLWNHIIYEKAISGLEKSDVAPQTAGMDRSENFILWQWLIYLCCWHFSPDLSTELKILKTSRLLKYQCLGYMLYVKRDLL